MILVSNPYKENDTESITMMFVITSPGVPINISLKWKQVAVANALAYHSKKIIMAVKIFIGQSHGANVIKLFTIVSYNFSY
jgi:hypothetical protein